MKKPLVISILLAIAPLSFAATHNLDLSLTLKSLGPQIAFGFN